MRTALSLPCRRRWFAGRALSAGRGAGRSARPLFAVSALSAGLLLAAAAAAACSGQSPETVVVAPGGPESLTETIAAVPADSTVVLGAGVYTEAVRIHRSDVSVVAAEPQTVEIRSPAADEPVLDVVGASGVRIEGLTLLGGASGVRVFQSQDVQIAGTTVAPEGIRGIDAVMSSVDVRDSSVLMADSPYAIGIRVANSLTEEPSRIEDNFVQTEQGFGIAINFAKAEIARNTVAGGTTGIGINEMSVARVAGNTIDGDGKRAILVVDMSSATLADNTVTGSQEELEVQYYSEVFFED